MWFFERNTDKTMAQTRRACCAKVELQREHHESALLQTDCKMECHHCDWLDLQSQRLQQFRIPTFPQRTQSVPQWATLPL